MEKKTTLTQWMVKPNRPFYQQPWYWGVVGAVALFFLGRRKGDSGKWPTIMGPLGIKWGTPTTRQWKGQPVGFMSGRKYTNTRKNLAKYTMKVAKDMGIPPEGLAVQFWVESQYNRNIVSPVGAKGIAQFMPLTGAAYGLVTGVTPAMEKEYKKRYRGGTAAQKMAAANWLLAQPGVTDNRDDARASIVAGAKYMKQNYLNLDKNWANAVGAYNCGPGCVRNRLKKGTPVPEETQKYIAAIAPYYHSTPVPTLVPPAVIAAYPWPTRAKVSA